LFSCSSARTPPPPPFPSTPRFRSGHFPQPVVRRHVAIRVAQGFQVPPQHAEVQGLFTGHPRPIAVKGIGHARKPPQDIQREVDRSEEHTSELQSREKLVCRLLLEK